MTKIILFVTPKSIITIANKAMEFVPVLGPGVEFTKKAKKMTEITDPVSASSRGVGMLFNYCFGKAGAVSLECIIWFGCSTVGGVTGNPVLIALGAQFGNLVVYDIMG